MSVAHASVLDDRTKPRGLWDVVRGDKSTFYSGILNVSPECVNHCCAECRQNPGNRTDANALMSNGIPVGTSVGTRGRGKSLAFAFELSALVFGLSVLASPKVQISP